MKRLRLIFTLLVAVQIHAYSMEVDLKEFHGRIAGINVTYQLPEVLTLNREYVGSYLYDKQNIPIPLTAIYRDNQLILTATPEDNSGTEIFIVKIDSQTSDNSLKIPTYVTGEWKKGGGNSYPFSITPHNFKDKHITCQEMHDIPDLVFTNDIDLGSGHGSLTTVDYNCEYDVRRNKAMQKLFEMADEIRGPHLASCMGSGRYARDRYSNWRLLTAAFSPETSLEDQNLQNYKELVNDYLKNEWSKSGIYNRQMYDNLVSEIASLKPLVNQYFLTSFPIDKEKAEQYTDNYFDAVIFRASGSLAYNWESIVEQDSLVRAVAAQRPLEEINNLLEKGDVNRAFEHASYEMEVMKLLLDAGANVNAQNYFGKTSLFYAVQYSNFQSAKFLIEQGADVNHQYFDKEELYGFSSHSCQPIRHTERTPLMHAAQHADLKTVHLLLDSGAELATRDEVGWTVVDYAKLNDNKDVLEYLSPLYNDLPEEIKSPPELSGKELEEWIDSNISQASKLMEGKNYYDAYGIYRKVFKKLSNNVPALIGLAQSAYYLDKNREALKYSVAVYESQDASPQQKVMSRLITFKVCRKREALHDQSHQPVYIYYSHNCSTSIDYLLDAAKIDSASVSQVDIEEWFSGDVNTRRYCALNTDGMYSMHWGGRYYYILSDTPVNPDIRAVTTDRTSHSIVLTDYKFTKVDEFTIGNKTVSRFTLSGGRGAVKYKDLYCSPDTIYPLPEAYDFIVVEGQEGTNVQLELSFSSPKIVMLYGNVNWNINDKDQDMIYLVVDGNLQSKGKKQSQLNSNQFKHEKMPNRYSAYFKSVDMLDRFKRSFGRELNTYFKLFDSGRFALDDSSLNQVKALVIDAGAGKMEFRVSTGRYRLVVTPGKSLNTNRNKIYDWELIKPIGVEVTEIVYDPSKTNIIGSLDGIKLTAFNDVDVYIEQHIEEFYYSPNESNKPILRDKEYFGAGNFEVMPSNSN